MDYGTFWYLCQLNLKLSRHTFLDVYSLQVDVLKEKEKTFLHTSLSLSLLVFTFPQACCPYETL